MWGSPPLLLTWRVEQKAGVGSPLALGVKLTGLHPCCLGPSSLSGFVWGTSVWYNMMLQQARQQAGWMIAAQACSQALFYSARGMCLYGSVGSL